MIAPLPSGPGSRSPGDQYGCKVRPIEPGGTEAISSSSSDSALTPRSAASTCSAWANSFLNQLTSQKPRWIWISVLKAPGSAAG